MFSSQVRFEQNIHVLDKWPLDLRIFLKTGNNRRAVLDKQTDAINKYCMIHYETQIHVIFFFFRFNTHYQWALFLTNHDWDKILKEWTKSMPIVFNPYKNSFSGFHPNSIYLWEQIFFHFLSLSFLFSGSRLRRQITRDSLNLYPIFIDFTCHIVRLALRSN